MYFSKEITPISNKNIGKCSAMLLREMHIQNTLRLHFAFSIVMIIENLEYNKC